MAKLRNISADTLHVPLVGAEVEPDHILELPDELLEQYAWPDTLWATVSTGKKTPTKDEE